MNLVEEIETLLRSANISPELERRIYAAFMTWEPWILERCRDFLLRNQLEPPDPAKQSRARWRAQNYGL
jgi:hypothetical protein